jgi:D-lactate dehydrogenase (cytochrome)
MDDIWQARRDAVAAYRSYRKDWDVAVLGDVVVPISKYPEIVEAVETVSEELSVLTPCVGHAGDGNLHYTPVVDTDDDESVSRAMELNDRIIERAIELGGTATGEHGIGIGKRKHLRKEYGSSVDVMRSIKETFDPNGIMNPGKVLPDRND